VTPDRHADYWHHWHNNDRIELTEQSDGDLGQRMATAAQRGLASGLPVMLIGTDCPQLEAPRLQAMAAALMKQDACLCPVLDGGYSLLGLRRFDAALFSDMPWSTDQVTTLTRDRLRQLGWRWHESEPLWDLDEPDDLARLEHYPSLSGHSI
jgi:rSAM/selenodomain-associated transferase 1